MNFKRIFIVLIMLISLLNTGLMPAMAVNFYDVNQNYWAYQAIQALSEQNIISGYPDNTFRPDNSVTRAEFAAMIIKTLNKEDMPVTRRAGFSDVPLSFWAYDNIQRAYDLGLISGFPNGTFGSSSSITRAEVLVILSKTVQDSVLSESDARSLLSRFYDANRVPQWAIIPVAKAVRANLAVNYPQPNFIMPEKFATRADVAAMLYNLRQSQGLGAQPPVTQQPVTVEQISEAVAGSTGNQVTLRGSIATLEQNSVIPTTLETPISSEVASVGDIVAVSVNKNIATTQGNLLIPAGSRINGTITEAVPAKFANRNARIAINFNSITLPSGRTYPLQAGVATESGVIEAGSLKGKIGKGVLTTIVGAGSGAALGTALGAITGSTGKGAIYGTAIGGGLGVVGGILAQGGEIKIPRGEPLFIKLNAPLSVDLNTGNIITP